MQKRCRNSAVQQKNQADNGENLILVIKHVPEFKRACDFSRTYEDATFWLLRDFVIDSILVAIKARLTLFSNDGNKHERAIITNDWVVNHLLRR